MKHITFIQPASSSAEMYVNPLGLQRFAGRLLEESASELFTIELIDLNIRASENADLSKVFSRTDILCIGTPAGCVEAIRQMPLQGFLSRGGALVFVGETVTDGLTEPFMREFFRVDCSVCALVGRSEDDFASLIFHLLGDSRPSANLHNVHWLDPRGEYRKGPEPIIPSFTRASRPFFPMEMIKEIRSRGLFLLLDGLTRGCEERCTYCDLNNRTQTAGRVQHVTFNAAEAVYELSTAIGRGLYVQFADQNFFGGRTRKPSEQSNRLARITGLSDDLKGLGRPAMMGVDTRADTVIDLDEDPLQAQARAAAWQAFANAGLRYVYLGIESLSKSQLKRYGKRLDLKCVPPALDFLEREGISYTVGLIIIDPLVTLEEIDDSLAFIEEHELYASVASLLKEMRVEVKGRYYEQLAKLQPQPTDKVDNFLFLDRDAVRYRDKRVAEVLPITRQVHRLFSNNGYRHSDLAAMTAFGGYVTGSSLAKIPTLIGKMEMGIWRYLIANQELPFETKRVAVLDLCQQTVANCTAVLAEDQLEKLEANGEREAIRGYYRRVLARIASELTPRSATAA